MGTSEPGLPGGPVVYVIKYLHNGHLCKLCQKYHQNRSLYTHVFFAIEDTDRT
jgi:hypothetical protein